MAVIGFIVCFIFLFLISAGHIVVSYCVMHKYNIGGVPYTWKDRIFIIPVGIILFYLWTLLIDLSPFTILINGN